MQLAVAEGVHRVFPPLLQRRGLFLHSEGRLRLYASCLALSPLAALACSSWLWLLLVLLFTLPYLLFTQPYVLLVVLVDALGVFDAEDHELFVSALGGPEAQVLRNCFSAAAVFAVLLFGPLSVSFAPLIFGFFAFAYWRMFSTFVRAGILMPATLTSKRHVPDGEVDARIDVLAPGETLQFAVSSHVLEVRRFHVQGAAHIDALGIIHPAGCGKWVVLFGGNGDFNSRGFEAKVRLGIQTPHTSPFGRLLRSSGRLG